MPIDLMGATFGALSRLFLIPKFNNFYEPIVYKNLTITINDTSLARAVGHHENIKHI